MSVFFIRTVNFRQKQRSWFDVFFDLRPIIGNKRLTFKHFDIDYLNKENEVVAEWSQKEMKFGMNFISGNKDFLSFHECLTSHALNNKRFRDELESIRFTFHFEVKTEGIHLVGEDGEGCCNFEILA